MTARSRRAGWGGGAVTAQDVLFLVAGVWLLCLGIWAVCAHKAPFMDNE